MYGLFVSVIKVGRVVAMFPPSHVLYALYRESLQLVAA